MSDSKRPTLIPESLEEQFEQWRNYLARRQTLHSVDIAELEDHLLEQVDALFDAGLAPDEAFLVAIKRIGDIDSLSREFSREHSERLWKQLVLSPESSVESTADMRRDAFVAFGLAIAAAVLIKLPALFGIQFESEPGFYARNLSFFVLPLLAGYFAWKRQLAPAALYQLAAAFAGAFLFANLYSFPAGDDLEILTALHLPIALWLAVGMAYAGERWSEIPGRMDFVRFSGELFIYYVLIALGGGVLTAFMAMIFFAIGIDIEPFFESWLLPCGAVGAVIVASWLVEAKQSVIENMAPVLARLFTPMFAAVLLTFLVTLPVTGRGVNIDRELLIAFDLLLVVVLGLLLYSISARDAHSPPGAFDVMQIVLVVSALLADAIALWAIAARISEFGFSPNRIAALGMNIILLVNLAWSVVLYVRFLRASGSFAALERWQTAYLPVYAVWAAIVVAAFPLVFA